MVLRNAGLTILILIMSLVVALVIQSIPDILRYLKMRQM